MKILIIIDSLGLGGAENLLYSNLKYSDQSKFNYTVITINKNPKDNLIKEINQLGINVIELSPQNHEMSLFRKFIQLFKILNNKKPQLIHTHLFYSDILGRFAGICLNLFGMKNTVISTLHCPVYSMEKNNSIRFKIRKRLDEITGKMINKYFIAVSEFVKKDFTNECGFKNIHIVHNGIDMERFRFIKNSKPHEIKKIVMVGRMESNKRQMNLIQAFQKIKNKYPDVSLSFIGMGKDCEKLKEYVEENAIKDIFFKGYIKNMHNALKEFDLMVHPVDYEGFGIVLIEAMAVGIPVIATNVTAIPEIIQDGLNGFLIRPRSVKEIVSGIERVIEMETEQIRDIVYNGRKTVENKFDIEKSTQLIEKYYNLI